MSNWPLHSLPPYAFPRLRKLLDGVEPGGPEIALSIGEPKHAFPDFIREILIDSIDGYGTYPPNYGTPELREATLSWLNRRYDLKEDFIHADDQILPLNGTREGLFNAGLATVPGSKGEQKPAVLMPNPFYQVYAASALMSHADPIYVSATKENNFLPDFTALDDETLHRTAAVYICSPANPQGTVASYDYWKSLLLAAQKYGFVIMADECYAEIYDSEPPAGALEAASDIAKDQGTDDILSHVLSFHSLSKRSNLPGLRSGFVTGGKDLIARCQQLRSYGGAPSPVPVYKAAAAAWNEDSHAAENRETYRAKLDIAEKIFQDRLGFFRPAGGFFLWLDVSQAGLTGEEATLKLWKEGGIKVLPGAYLAQATSPGPGEPEVNPGENYIRVALVHDLDVTEKALTSVNQILS